MSLAATRRELLLRFRAMYQAKHFEIYLFDLERQRTVYRSCEGGSP